MNIWICDPMRLRPFILLGAAVLLSGCLSAPESTVSATATQLPLVGGQVVLKAPSGYCIDLETVEDRRSRGFAMMASCRILSGGQTGGNVPPVLVTATVGGEDPGAQLPTPTQIASSSGVALIEGQTRDQVSVAHLADGGIAILDGGDRRYWRAVTLIGARQVGLALYAPDKSAMAASDGGSLLQAVALAARDASPDASGRNLQEDLPVGTDAAMAVAAVDGSAVLPRASQVVTDSTGQAEASASANAEDAPKVKGLGASTGSLFNGSALQ